MKKMDERQVILRGKAFKHVAIITGILLGLSFLLAEFGFGIAEGGFQHLFTGIIPNFIGMSEMVAKDIFGTSYIFKIIFLIISGTLGIGLLAISIVQLFQGNGFTDGNYLSTTGLAFIMGIFLIVLMIFILTKLIKDIKNRKKIEPDATFIFCKDAVAAKI